MHLNVDSHEPLGADGGGTHPARLATHPLTTGLTIRYFQKSHAQILTKRANEFSWKTVPTMSKITVGTLMDAHGPSSSTGKSSIG